LNLESTFLPLPEFKILYRQKFMLCCRAFIRFSTRTG